MAYYNKKLGVYLPTTKEITLEKPKKPKETPPPPVEPPIEEPPIPLSYYYERDEEENKDWWICNTCGRGYDKESIQKSHQTKKHK